jgi:kynurenine formamidase
MIDLSHVITPGSAGRKFSVEMVGADSVNPKVVRLDGQWYIMHNVSMVNHIGTHIEAPFHLSETATDLAGLTLDQLTGDAVLLDLRACARKSAISEQHVCEAAARVGGIRHGDIVFCNLGGARHYGTPDYGLSPYFSPEAMRWLVAQGMKMMGVDAGGVEVPGSEEHVNHHALFDQNIPLIENLTNLDALTSSRFTVYALPIAIAGLDAFPLRVIAIEP